MHFKNHLLNILIGFILTVIFTWPFASVLGSFYYDHGDYPVSGSILAYNENAFKTGEILNRDLYFHGNEFYPQPFALVYFDARLISSLIYSPIYWVIHNFILSINVVTFLTFVLSFITSFYTINFFVKNKLASIIGATIYAFNPITLGRFPEHFNLLNRYFLPLVFLFAYKFLKNPGFKNAFLFFLIFTLNAFSDVYFQVFTILLLPLFALPFLISNLKAHTKGYFFALLKSSLVFLIFLPIIIYFDSAYLNFAKQENLQRSLDTNAFLSARVMDYFSPMEKSLLYKPFVKSLSQFREPKDFKGNFNYPEHTLFLTVTAMTLFLLFLVYYFRKRKRIKLDFLLAPFVILMVVSFVFTFGPFFQGWNNRSSDIKTPFYFLYKALPLLQGTRAPARFQFMFYIPFSLFVSLGATCLFKKIKNKIIVIFISFIILFGLFAENYSSDGSIFSYSEKSPMIQEVNQINGKNNKLGFLSGKKVLHFPIRSLEFEHGFDSAYLNWAAITGEKIVNGNVASYLPLEQYTFLDELKDGPDETSFKKLKAIDVDFVIVHLNLIKGQNIDLSTLSRGIIYNDENIVIFDLKKYEFNIKKCSFKDDFTKDFRVVFVSQSMQTENILILKNRSDCFLPSIYMDKYKSSDFDGRDFYGKLVKRKAYYKLPVLIMPFQEVILSGMYNNLRIE